MKLLELLIKITGLVSRPHLLPAFYFSSHNGIAIKKPGCWQTLESLKSSLFIGLMSFFKCLGVSVFVMGSTVRCAWSLLKGDADMSRKLSRNIQMRNSSSVHVCNPTESCKAFFFFFTVKADSGCICKTRANGGWRPDIVRKASQQR